ncbi:MAG: hypothetical protein IH855_04265 [Bacteroidetes bacterium]|nr:hypothetical protein [Bacteroidota bacterium]
MNGNVSSIRAVHPFSSFHFQTTATLTMIRTSRIAILCTVVVLLFTSNVALAQDDTMVPDTIVVPVPGNDARNAFNEGNALLRDDDNEGALAKFEEGLRLNPRSARNAYGRALALAQLEREDDASVAFDNAIQLADAANDEETAAAARRALGTISYRNAIGQLQAFPLPADAAQSALPLLRKAEEGNLEQPMLPYQFARVYNALEQYEEAERYAMQAVENRDESADDHSALYYELGLARVGAGHTEGALEAFEMAKNGTWAGWAEFQINEINTASEESGEESSEGSMTGN